MLKLSKPRPGEGRELTVDAHTTCGLKLKVNNLPYEKNTVVFNRLSHKPLDHVSIEDEFDELEVADLFDEDDTNSGTYADHIPIVEEEQEPEQLEIDFIEVELV